MTTEPNAIRVDFSKWTVAQAKEFNEHQLNGHARSALLTALPVITAWPYDQAITEEGLYSLPIKAMRQINQALTNTMRSMFGDKEPVTQVIAHLDNWNVGQYLAFTELLNKQDFEALADAIAAVLERTSPSEVDGPFLIIAHELLADFELFGEGIRAVVQALKASLSEGE